MVPLYIFSPSYPKISSCPKNTQLCQHNKIPSLESSLSTSLGFWDMGQHRTTIKWKTFSHPTLKYPAAPKIPSSVNTTKYPAWSRFWSTSLGFWGHGTASDHYKCENFLHPTLKYSAAPKIPSSVQTKNTQLGVFLSTSLGFWDLGRHGTTIKRKTISILPQKTKQLPKKQPAPSIPVFLLTPLTFGTWGQHGTNGKQRENKSWLSCHHPLALGRPGLQENVVSLGDEGGRMLEGCGTAK